MSSPQRLLCPEPVPAFIFFISLLAAAGSAAGANPSLQLEAKNNELGKVKSIAESQHEIVLLLMEKKQFGEALTEANKIFEMNWPENQEPVLLKELLNLADRFMHKDQAALGLQLLETNQRTFKSTPSQIALWKERGYLLKKMNQTDKALACFREAQRLEKSSSH